MLHLLLKLWLFNISSMHLFISNLQCGQVVQELLQWNLRQTLLVLIIFHSIILYVG